ncbi:MAG: hypothetical protein IMZ53_09555 [Thermoplasmata archaeon]|nr:hypothetical protein [Thermoplasmata archaeon]MBE3140815.1 hypothetical protein [Thermoplasmata archaeon]
MTTEKRNKIVVFLKKLGIGSGITIVGITGGIWWSLAQGVEKVLDPHIVRVACRVDSISLIPIKEEIIKNKKEIKGQDTTLRVIRSLLEVIATNDQKTEAYNLRNSGIYR